jgi:hypothetical protein
MFLLNVRLFLNYTVLRAQKLLSFVFRPLIYEFLFDVTTGYVFLILVIFGEKCE